jgi:hypothetical protein
MSRPPTDYVEVHQRMATFFARYPEGSLAMDPPQIVEVAGKFYMIGQAKAYRTPDDAAPGVGTAWEPVPGTTNFTKGSEAQNLETSAWGRAMAALGIETKKGIASAHEVRSARGRESAPEPPPSVIDLDVVAAQIAKGDLALLRDVWAAWHKSPHWPAIEPLIADRRAQLDAT